MPEITFKEIAKILLFTVCFLVICCVLMALVVVMADVSFSIGYMLIDKIHADLGVK